MPTKDSRTLFRLAGLFLFGVIPVIVVGVLRLESNMEDVEQWLPDDSPDRETYQYFQSHFGVDDFIVATWDGCTVNDDRLNAFSNQVRSTAPRGMLREVVSGREFVVEIAARTGERPANVARRFRGILFGPDVRQTCVAIVLDQFGMEHRRDVVELLRTSADAVAGLSRKELILGGYPYVGAQADQEIRRSGLRLLLPACILATFCAWLFLQNIRLIAIGFFVAVIAAGLSVAMVTLWGSKWGGISSIIPTLAFILTISGSLHLIRYSAHLRQNPSRDAAASSLAVEVLRVGWKPCVVSSVSTAIGMFSLGRSSFPAIREFGIYCALGVLGSLACQLLLIPVLLQWLQRDSDVTDGLRDSRLAESFLRQVLRHRAAVLAIFAILLGIGTWGLPRLIPRLEVEGLFREDSQFLQEMAWFEEKLGPLEQSELCVIFESPDPEKFDLRLEAIRNVVTLLRASPMIHAVQTAADYLPPQPSGRSLAQTAARAAYRQRVNSLRAELHDGLRLSLSDEDEVWRISIRVPFTESSNFDALHHTAISIAADGLGSDRERIGPTRLIYTGISQLYHVAQKDLLSDLAFNFLMAFAMITPMMMITLGSLQLGLLAMIPNVTPTVIVFGGFGYFGVPVDMGTAITASVALGIAVDDTSHFLIRFRELNRTHSNSYAAFQMAFRQCSAAMIQTTVIIGTGLWVFRYASLLAMAKFAEALMGLLVIALMCDLFLLPALVSLQERFNEEINGPEEN